MDPSSPTKRRALAPLDANVNAMSPTKMHNKTKMPGSPLKSPIRSPLGLKRPLAAVFSDENAVAKKKQCQEPVAAPPPTPAAAAAAAAAAVAALSAPAPVPAPTPASSQTEMDTEPDAKEGQSEPQQEQETEQPVQQPEVQNHDQQHQQLPPQTSRNRSASPDTSSVFDNSAMDTSQNTTILTEPDLEQARTLPPPRPRRLLTREEARQKARILRLKLGLANYKLQTGQEDVPLDKLQRMPLPGHESRRKVLPRVTVQPPSSRDGPPEKDAEDTAEREQQEPGTDTTEETQEQSDPEKAVLPRLEAVETTCDDGGDSTSAVCGGAVSSLLSLARASSSVSSSS